jgi:hypothetical protein
METPMTRILGTLALAASLALPSLAQAQVLDLGEEKHLVFMREEEKLARDVYLTFAKLYPRTGIFANIATGSEQTHTDQVQGLLAAYAIADPVVNEAAVGLFSGADFGWYFAEKFDSLVAKGRANVLSALYVGAFIEELDMQDIAACPGVIQTSFDLTVAQCGLDYTDEPRIQTVLGNLLDASKNHLRSYVSQIERTIGAGNYVAQVLSQEEVDAILGR